MSALDTRVKYPQLQDELWLRRRLELGHNTVSIAAELGCSDPLVGKALRRFGLKPPGTTAPPQAFIEPEPEPELRALQGRLLALSADEGVPDAELKRRAEEGLEHLAALVDLAGRLGRALYLSPDKSQAKSFAVAATYQEYQHTGSVEAVIF